MPFVNVAIPVPLHTTFTYSLPEGYAWQASPGMRVVVPFRKKKRIGYITEFNADPPENTEIKEIADFPDDEPLLSEKMMTLIRWVSDYYSAPIGEVCATALPNLLNSEKEIGKKRRETQFGYNIDGFEKETLVKLNSEQEKIFSDIITQARLQDVLESNHSSEICSGKFSVHLLHGVTGSGKTEIYLKLMEKVVSAGKDAILLVPEISLTPQLAGRVISQFGKDVAVYHSGLTEVQRLNQWKKIKNGKVKIAVGTRSAIYAPFKNLGLIIVDEEHDHSYKQEESPRYNARDTAIMRAKLENGTVLLGSATPSIESLANARSGKYKYYHLSERHGTSKMPKIEVVDMRKQIKSKLLNPYLSIELLTELKKVIKKGRQALLFLNRRGYANFYLCEDCGHIPECPNCKITLTYHKKLKIIGCHYCDYKIKVPDTCPSCRGINLVPMGSGTEMIEEVIKNEISEAKIARLDRDTTTTEKKRSDVLKKMHSGELDILIGTQMITKGHDFPNVTLVGIISADQSIHFPDFRASERTFQLLTQVSGRAGRSLHPGKVIIQTYSPDHISIQMASKNSLNDFISNELELRKELHYPPYWRLANVRISGNKSSVVKIASDKVFKLLAGDNKLKLLGPAPAPLAMLRGKTRWQILIKSPSAKLLAGTLSKLKWHLNNQPIRGVQISIDVDPISTM